MEWALFDETNILEYQFLRKCLQLTEQIFYLLYIKKRINQINFNQDSRPFNRYYYV